MTSSTEAFLLSFHARHARSGGAFFDVGEITPNRGSYDLLINSIEPDAPNVLDVGCGDGALLARLEQRYPGRVVGLDFSPELLTVARARLPDHVRLICARAQEIPLDDAAVGAVVSHMALMLMDDFDRVLGEVRRVSKPGSTFCAVVSGPPSATEESQRFFSALREKLRAEDLVPRFGADCFRSVEGIVATWSKAGFNDIVVEDHVITRRVPVDQLRDFFEQAYYPVALLSLAAQASLGSQLTDLFRHLVRDGHLAWQSTIRCIRAKR